MIDWGKLLKGRIRRPATEEAITLLLATVGAALSCEEIEAINASQSNPFPPTDPLHASYKPHDPSRWTIPDRPLPPSFLSFLRWSDGGGFVNGEREFGMFSTSGTNGLREMLLAYNVPEYMPGVLPFAFNGGGKFYLFDMREPAVEGEYPILCASSGNLGFHDCKKVADSFPETCRGTVNVEELLFGD